MAEVIDAVERHAAEHLRFGAVPAADVAEFEARIGRRLPPALAEALETIGNGIFFGKEELLGPRRLMVHDIELLPDMLSVKARAEGLPADWLPFHRRDATLHVVDLAPASFGEVRSWPDGRSLGDVAAFLAALLSDAERR